MNLRLPRRDIPPHLLRFFRPVGFKSKDLIDLPHMTAEALRADGWYLRSAITWVKRAPMPESVTDRPTSATEMIFLLARQPRYYFDQDAVREPAVTTAAEAETKWASRRNGTGKGQPEGVYHPGAKPFANDPHPGGRNLRNAWILSPEPLSEPHYAAFPSEIPRRAILAGTSEAGCCPTCAAPWVRVVKRLKGATEAAGRPKHLQSAASTLSLSGGSQGWAERGSTVETTGWRPSCSCDAGPPVPCTALDPFAGSGTTWVVANELGRRFVGIELSPTYVEIAKRRAAQAGFAAAYDAPAVGEG